MTDAKEALRQQVCRAAMLQAVNVEGLLSLVIFHESQS
jgi:hypothetical protein